MRRLNKIEVGLLVMVTVIVGGRVSGTGLRQAGLQNKTNSALEALHDIGIKVSQAVLSRDTETLLSYDRPDLRDIDRGYLKDSRSNLYCMMSIPSVLRGVTARCTTF